MIIWTRERKLNFFREAPAFRDGELGGESEQPAKRAEWLRNSVICGMADGVGGSPGVRQRFGLRSSWRSMLVQLAANSAPQQRKVVPDFDSLQWNAIVGMLL